MVNLTRLCIGMIPVASLTLVACFERPTIVSMKSASVIMETPKPKKTIKVMVIDTGIGPHSKLKGLVQYDGSNDYVDNHGHGTHVAGIIVYGSHLAKNPEDFSDKLCDNVEIMSCRYYNPKAPSSDNLEATILCVEKAIREGVDYINYSGGGSEYSQAEYDAYKKFTINGGIVVAAAGNERSNISLFPYYPASYGVPAKDKPALNNIIIVQNVDEDGNLVKSSNWYSGGVSHLGKNILSFLPNDSAGYMTGTSQAAPGVLHEMLKKRCSEINK